MRGSGEKENKCMHAGEPEDRRRPKDGEKTDGEDRERTRAGRRGHDDGGPKGSGSAKKR